MSHGRSKQQSCASRSDARNLITLVDNTRWTLPVILGVNARSLSIEKADELLSVSSLNDVSCVCVTETWFKDFMSDESVGLPGYFCERKHRVGRVGGGVACYVAATVPYDRLLDIEDNEHEVMWIRLRLHKLPRRFASIVIACIYHPPNSDNSNMREYIIATLDGILRRHPDCGIILIGDFNQLRDMFLRTQYGFAQLVNTATRNSAILDKLWTNMEPVYDTPAVLDTLGTSDHRMVLLKPSYDAILDTGNIQRAVVRRFTANEKAAFASALSDVSWEHLYTMTTCEEQFNFFQRTMEELMVTHFPYKSVTRHTADKPWVTDYFRHLIRQRQRAIMSGDIDEARRLRNLVNRTAPKLRQRFYQSKIATLEETSSKDWWKHMKRKRKRGGVGSGGIFLHSGFHQSSLHFT